MPLPYWVNVQADLVFAGYTGLTVDFVVHWPIYRLFMGTNIVVS